MKSMCHVGGVLGMFLAACLVLAALLLDLPAITVAAMIAIVALPAIVFVGCALLAVAGSVLGELERLNRKMTRPGATMASTPVIGPPLR